MNTKVTLAESKKNELIKILCKQFLAHDYQASPQMEQALLSSDYIGEQLKKYPHLIADFQRLKQPVDELWCNQQLSKYQPSDKPEAMHDQLSQFLRHFRHKAMVRIISRMVNGIAGTSDTLEEISQLAIVCVQFAMQELYKYLAAHHGAPKNEQGKKQQLLVIAMGKLGGKELNLSSDIDLIFVYEKETFSKDQKIATRVFFTQLGQQLIRLLNDTTEDGFVFRVDMRLRPYGSSGSLVASFAELRKYYKEQAREWERFALARAKVITGDKQSREELQKMIDGFVFRQYVDFSVIRSLRNIKSDIRKQALRRGREQDIKLGSGGIREVEFIVQAYQLIYGGKHHEFRTASTRQVLFEMAKGGYLDKKVIKKLDENYLFLRHLENHIQAFRDQQTHKLPDIPEQQERLALAMGYHDWQQLNDECQQCRDEVKNIFNDLILGESQETKRKAKLEQKWVDLSNELFSGRFDSKMFDENEQALTDLIAKINKTSDETQQICRSLIPFLFQSASTSQKPSLALSRLISLVEATVRRSVYLNLLNENIEIIPLLCHSMFLSNWLADNLCKHPALLEAYVHNDNNMPDSIRVSSYDRLRNILSSFSESDEEQQIEAMRYFSRDASFRVALAQISNRLSLPRVSDWLTFTAEACITEAFHFSWNHLTARHGLPENMDHNDDPEASAFAIIAYGKLGGIEMNYTSDLDLVFIYSGNPNDMTNGDKPISLVQLYTRLAQRIIHILSTPTSAGKGYELDTRLRPQGNKGLLVNSIQGLKDYMHSDAWTWEHQAMVRSRGISGDQKTIELFNQLRKETLCLTRDRQKLSRDIWQMRQRIDQAKQDKDIKYGAGGLVDIEFLVQFLVLANAHEHPEIIASSDNLRQIDALNKASIINKQEKESLTKAYIEMRTASHYLALGIDNHNIDIEMHSNKVQELIQKWKSSD